MKYVYLSLSIVGVIIPYYFGYLIFRDTGGFDLGLFIKDATNNNSSAFLAGDLSITAITAIVYISYEGFSKKISYWWVSILGIFLVGVSFGFPYFLYLRECSNQKIAK